MAMEYTGEGSIPDIRARLPKRRGQVTFGTNGTATIEFNPPISLTREPFVQLTPRIAPLSAEMVIANLVDGSFTTNAQGMYTSVQIKGGRLRANLPTLTVLSLGALLTSVVTGVNAIVTALTGLTLVNSTTISGVKVDWQAS
ncbi:hypothetical protein ASE67_02680 [Sphingomonas sp. Leaf23]|uniref:hypothetical protein n=1 Tax=Sphingomonas sp. Leaf23 TaxID=1735689 RepID=UPI0006F23B0D|nr:hypothetical protein [Sphingomonas sp. Leaf23]KQM88665.1 hypothetical protein ASE67_02680 [Sphingomonas sp. Leaf23]